MLTDTNLARVDDNIPIISFKKVLRKKQEQRPAGFSLSTHKELKYIPLKHRADEEEEFPMHKWTMPAEPQRYLKYPAHDFL